MRKHLIISIIFTIVSFFILNSYCSRGKKDIENFENLVGNKINYLGDTLVIINSSYLKSSYTLQDGTEVDKNYVLKNIINE